MLTKEKKTTAPAEQKTPDNIPESFNFAPLRLSAIAMGKIAKTTENKTFLSIAFDLFRGMGAVGRYLRTAGADPQGVDLFIDSLTLPRYDTEVNSEGVEVVKKTLPPVFGSDTAEVFCACRMGYNFPEDEQGELLTDPTEEDRRKAGYKSLNKYLWGQRSNRAKEVLTPYTWEQIEQATGEDEQGQTFTADLFEVTDTTWKKTVRRIFDGLTDTEQGEGVEDFDTPIIQAVREVSEWFSPAQVKVAKLMGEGYGIHGIANKLYRTPEQKRQGKRADTKTTKEHKKAIEKKLSAHPVIAEELTKTRREKAPAPAPVPDLLDTIDTPQGEVIPTPNFIRYICGAVRVELSKTHRTDTPDTPPTFAPVPACMVWDGQTSSTLFEKENRSKKTDTADTLAHALKQAEYNRLFGIPEGENTFAVYGSIRRYLSIDPADYIPTDTPAEYILVRRYGKTDRLFPRFTICPAPIPAPIRRPQGKKAGCEDWKIVHPAEKTTAPKKAKTPTRPAPQTRTAPALSAWKVYTDRQKAKK